MECRIYIGYKYRMDVIGMAVEYSAAKVCWLNFFESQIYFARNIKAAYIEKIMIKDTFVLMILK